MIFLALLFALGSAACFAVAAGIEHLRAQKAVAGHRKAKKDLGRVEDILNRITDPTAKQTFHSALVLAFVRRGWKREDAA